MFSNGKHTNEHVAFELFSVTLSKQGPEKSLVHFFKQHLDLHLLFSVEEMTR